MIPHDILTLYSAKMVEYGIAIIFLLLFIPFWKFVQGGVQLPARAVVHNALRSGDEWFPLPADRLFHRGHAWARPDSDGLVTVGLDDFAAHLVGPMARVSLPAVGTSVGQGEPGWRLVGTDEGAVEMLSPVDGTVAAINTEAADNPQAVQDEPYEKGWLLKIRPSRLRANRTNLLTGASARLWMRQAVAGLQAQMAPALGELAQDGGSPLPGMARALAPQDWTRVARVFLLTDEEDSRA